MTDDATVPVSKKMIWAGRIMSTLPVLMLLMSGVMKFVMHFAKPPEMVEQFSKFGYSESVLLPLGVVELVCTLLYIIPRTSVLGAILLTGYLGGATATHVRVADSFIAPIILGVLIWGGLFLRDARIRAIVPLRS